MRVSGQRAGQRHIDGLMKLQNDAPAAHTADPALSKKAASDAVLAALTLVASTILFPSPNKTPPR